LKQNLQTNLSLQHKTISNDEPTTKKTSKDDSTTKDIYHCQSLEKFNYWRCCEDGMKHNKQKNNPTNKQSQPTK